MENLIGKVIVFIKEESDGLTFITNDNTKYVLCGDDGYPNDCEVWLESVVGDLQDLVGSPLLVAQEVSGQTVADSDKQLDMSLEKNRKHAEYSQNWTFYKFATIKGYVDLRFCGESNGYYSEKAFLYNLGLIK